PPRRGALSDYKLAVWLDDPAFPVDAEGLRVLGSALDPLRAAGATLDDGARPEVTLAEIFGNYRRLLDPMTVADIPSRVHERLIERAQQPLRPDAPDDEATRFARSAMARHVHWLRAHERRMRHRARMAEFFERFDAL